MTDADYTNDLALLTNIPAQAESLLQILITSCLKLIYGYCNLEQQKKFLHVQILMSCILNSSQDKKCIFYSFRLCVLCVCTFTSITYKITLKSYFQQLNYLQLMFFELERSWNSLDNGCQKTTDSFVEPWFIYIYIYIYM